MGAERSIARAAFAKINLDLRVLGLRPDGYHELRTTFQSIALADALTFTPIPGPFRIVCDNPDCPADSRNLVWRAAELLWRAARRTGAPRDVVVTIAKRIPIQGGLGGGSSDAAAALTALASLWRTRLTRARLRGLASAIGADVPYFSRAVPRLGGRVAIGCRGFTTSPSLGCPRRSPLRRQHCRGVRVVGHAGRPQPTIQSGRPGRHHERFAARGIAASSRCFQAGRGARTPRRVSSIVIGQRVRRVWFVPAPGARGARRQSAAPHRPAPPCAPDPDVELAGMSQTCRQVSPSYRLRVCAT